MCRRTTHVDDYVTESILKRLSRPDAALLFAADDSDDADDVAVARRELAELEERLEEVRVSAEDPVNGISITTAARIERALEPQIAAARARTVPHNMPALIRQGLAAPDKWVWWYGNGGNPEEDGLSVPDRRFVVRELLTVAILKSPSRNGARGFDPSLITIDWLKV